MRYEDWDVLVFPTGDFGHIPQREFRTACHAAQTTVIANTTGLAQHKITPLLTCFIPSLEADTPFQISVHSWTPQNFVHAPLTEGPAPPQAWRFKIVIDQVPVCIEIHPADIAWPHVFSTANLLPALPGGILPPLQFPRFHPAITAQRSWSATEETGRIKVKISEGYLTQKGGRTQFVKLHDHVHFNFQPAPLKILASAGISWPNEALRHKMVQAMIESELTQASFLRGRSVDNSDAKGSLPSPPAGTFPAPPPSTPDRICPADIFSQSHSQGLSAAATYASSTAAMSLDNDMGAVKQSNGQETDDRHRLEVRMSSDQLQRLLAALEAQSSHRSSQSDASSMLPPPVPPHASTSVVPTNYGDVTSEQRGSTPTLAASYVPGRRMESHSNESDISMHSGCAFFPACTVEDDHGRLVHQSSSPADVVRSRKEGSTEPANRDFLLSLLDAAATPPTIKSDRVDSPQNPLADAIVEPPNRSLPAVAADTKKRGRVTLKTRKPADAAQSTEAETPKPPRKVSRASLCDKENVLCGSGSPEAVMTDV